MPFKKGVKHAKQGTGDYSNAGRPTKEVAKAKALIADKIKKELEKQGLALVTQYIDRGLNGSGRILIDAMNRLAPVEESSKQAAIQINFVRYDGKETTQ